MADTQEIEILAKPKTEDNKAKTEVKEPEESCTSKTTELFLLVGGWPQVEISKQAQYRFRGSTGPLCAKLCLLLALPVNLVFCIVLVPIYFLAWLFLPVILRKQVRERGWSSGFVYGTMVGTWLFGPVVAAVIATVTTFYVEYYKAMTKNLKEPYGNYEP